jgi:signal peptidase
MRQRRDGTEGTDRSSLRRDTRGGSFLDDFITSVFAVVGIGILLFAISGVWPPMVAIESPSMTPNIDTGDLVFVMEEHRFAPEETIGETGVVTAYRGQRVGYGKFNLPGDVIVYAPNGDREETPVIHRAVFWVNKSENWYPKVQEQFVPSDVESCDNLGHCPAPNRGFVTLGDANPQYDQVEDPSAVSRPVKPEWVIGTAEFRMPGLGWLRLRAASLSPIGGVSAAEIAAG